MSLCDGVGGIRGCVPTGQHLRVRCRAEGMKMGPLWGRGTDPALMALGGDLGAVGPGLNARGGGKGGERRGRAAPGAALEGTGVTRGSSEHPDPIGGSG